MGATCDNKGRQIFNDKLWEKEKGVEVGGKLDSSMFWYDFIYEGEREGQWTPWLTFARGTVGQQVPAMGLVPTPQPGSFCLQMPIIAVPLLVPMMPPPSTVSASVTTNSPMRTFASPVSAEADETPRSAYTCCIDEEVETPRYHYIPQEEATKGGKAPPSFYEYLDESDEEKVTPQVTSSTDLEMSPTSEEFDSEISTPREHFWRRATVEIEWSVQRTFIHFNTCDTPARRRSKSIG